MAESKLESTIEAFHYYREEQIWWQCRRILRELRWHGYDELADHLVSTVEYA